MAKHPVAFCYTMCSLERFLCCMELEKGAVALGWFSFIKNFITMIFFCCVILVRMTFDCSQMLSLLQFFNDEITLEKCIYVTEEGYVVLIATTMIIAYIGLTYISYKFVKATKTRKHKEVVPFMTYLVVMTITSFLAIFFFSIRTLIVGTVTGLFYFYFLLCVGALYERFLKEHNERQKVLRELATKNQPRELPVENVDEPIVCTCRCHEKERHLGY